MIRAVDIQDNLLHLIGWEQSQDVADLKISEPLTISESGLYFQQVHPLLTLQNLYCIAPDFKGAVYEEYSVEKKYAKRSLVQYNDFLYKAKQPSIGKIPRSENDYYWQKTTAFSEWLESKTKASIQKAITRYCTEKVVQGAKTLCENKTLFDGTGRIVDTVKNRKNLVGFEVIPIRAKGVTTKINKIGLQFTEPGEYTLYLMHSSRSEPVKVITLNKRFRNSLEWFTFNDLFLPYQSESTDAGGSWYLCYFQSELPVGSKAIKKDRDWSKGPCSSCSRTDYISWVAWSKYLEVHPFYVNEELCKARDFSNDFSSDFGGKGTTDITGKSDFSVDFSADFSIAVEKDLSLWDIQNNRYSYDNNYGLNLELTVACDLTDFILEQRALFQDIIAKQVAIDMLKELAYNANVRANRHSINASRLDILYEIDGDSASMKKSGLSYQLDLAFKALNISTQGLDRACLPCKNNGIKYRVV